MMAIWNYTIKGWFSKKSYFNKPYPPNFTCVPENEYKLIKQEIKEADLIYWT